ncbi:uridine kinase [Fusarium longipes]|uniref:uridine/cytidine kinase n=1 Tax=Fusarium longipes TaxID=694270 RepID=A0A395T1J7_9HYPO|nr:uridine kinase [Fusarium longipes]
MSASAIPGINGGLESHVTIQKRAYYSPPWADVSIIGVAGSSGSGKSTLSQAIVKKLNLPWDSFYKTLTPEQSKKAFANEHDFDSPDVCFLFCAIDFDVLVEKLRDLKAGKRAEIPVYSFAKHARLDHTTSIYSPHVLVLEGIFALYDPRVIELLDMGIYCEADADTCLSRRLVRDVRERGRDIEGIIKQWFGFVKPNFEKFVEPQRKVADLIVPRGIENRVALDMMVQFVEKKLFEKSRHHREALSRLEVASRDSALSDRVVVLNDTPQLKFMNTILQDIDTDPEDFIFYFDRLASLIIEQALNNAHFEAKKIITPQGYEYNGLAPTGEVCAVIVLRGGSAFEPALRKTIPDCRTGRLLIQSDYSTGEPELHYLRLPDDIASQQSVLLLDTQMATGGAALMAVQVLVDHGVQQDRIVLATYSAGKVGIHRLTSVFPEITVVVCNMLDYQQERWVEKSIYLIFHKEQA